MVQEARWYEGLFGGITKRLDYTNALLANLITLQGGVPPGPYVIQVPPGPSTPVPQPSLSNLDSFATGQQTVVTAGTAVQLSTSLILIPNGFQLTIIAKPGNVGTIYLGKSKSDAEGSQVFDGLDPGLAASLRIKSVGAVWVNGDTGGDGVSWIVETQG